MKYEELAELYKELVNTTKEILMNEYNNYKLIEYYISKLDDI